jgi:CheY-like chemotaxis protein
MVSGKSLEGVSILIVDDNDDARYVLESILRYAGALPIAAEGGKEALSRLSTMRVDVIVSDISMPGFSGHDFIRRVRQLPPHRETPAIALTAFDDPGQREEALRAGFQLYFVKPFDAQQLVRAITSLVLRPTDRPRRRRPGPPAGPEA